MHRCLVKVNSATCTKKAAMVKKTGEAMTAHLSKVKAGGRASPGYGECERLKPGCEERAAAVEAMVLWQSCRLTGGAGKQG